MEKLNQLLLLVGRNKKPFCNQLAIDKFFAGKFLFAVDQRVQRWWRMCKQASIACTQVNKYNALKFEDLLEQEVLNGTFQMNLPASFKKVANPSKTAAAKETKHATAGNKGEGNNGNKKEHKSKNGNGNGTRHRFCIGNRQILERHVQQPVLTGQA